MEKIISCKNLTHYYGKRCIYENLNFDIPKGRIMGLLGKNGTGKTTTINILNGYLQPRSGECTIFDENINQLSAKVRARIGLLIEGHVQYAFMNVSQIESFYSKFYPKWQKKIYYDLIAMLKINPKQRISQMSCGQRSQVALGLILAQDADLLILDDFSMGLDPGYRRLFVDFLSEYARDGQKTVFVTSHIIQDMERLIDDCMIMDYGKILLQKPIEEILTTFHRYRLPHTNIVGLEDVPEMYHPSIIKDDAEFYSFMPIEKVKELLHKKSIDMQGIKKEKLTLEEAFIGLTGKY